MTTRLRLALAAALTATVLGVGPALGHGPVGLLGGRNWAMNQAVTFTWTSGQVPPAWMQAAIEAGAEDSNDSRASRAAIFSRATGASSLFAYGEPAACSSNGLACTNRSGAPNDFRIWFRAQGFVYDFGTLKWCQAPNSDVKGCVDAESAALHELGHVENLAHHDDFTDGSDYFDTVMHAFGRVKPKDGYNQRAYGPCDTARLQMEYDLLTWATPVSTCLSIPTTLTLASSPPSASVGQTIQLSATLKTASGSVYRALSSDPLSERVVTIQRRLPGGPWSSPFTMTPSATAGTYVYTWSPTTTYEWQATFATPAGEGITGSTSSVLSVTVSGCSLNCPQMVVSGE
jgi:hypothetical protein